METCYKSEYLTINYESESDILYALWITPEFMLDEEYREAFKNVEKNVVKKQTLNLLINTANTQYVVPVETQEWATERINKLTESYPIKKVAFVMSTDFLAQLSVELIQEDVQTQHAQTQFFDSEEKALEWIKSGKNPKENAA